MSERSFAQSMAWLARARRVVPGTSQTLSKGPAMFVEGAYPVFLERGRGARVWDVDGNEYVDYIMGLASITLGYAYPAVTEAVARQLERGSIFSLPHPLEVEVSERLSEIIPCAEMVRFVKTGSEADAAVVRVARAATGRDIVVFAGYHGWHEWYAITTPRSKGIPKDAARLVAPFQYNDLDSLERVLEEHHGQVAAVMMEPVLLDAPASGFLAGVKGAAHRHGALLIFDEVKCGAAIAPGGAIERYGVQPDLACFAKAICGGTPGAAFGGRADIMETIDRGAAHQGTFNGNPLVAAAGLAALTEVLVPDAYEYLAKLGTRMADGCAAALKEYGIPGHAVDLGAKGCVSYRPQKLRNYRDFLEADIELFGASYPWMVNRGVFMTPGDEEQWTLSVQHTEADVDRYVENFTDLCRELAS
jgi:glutamate-1-semialdehyde-2,1-aminomutase